jgi:malate/lactate dehydrogenase
VVSEKGIERIIDNKLSDEEMGLLKHSADVLKAAIREL